MTAWLAANCAVDDILETMPPAAATLALQEAISNLQGKKANGRYIEISHGNIRALRLVLMDSFSDKQGRVNPLFLPRILHPATWPE